mmetsp:Transcript_25600/g.82619  ORF Transcript_25600/g.82619 Transcript_25600/m.82619 type:complete len:594 (+) Transcript_25600:441-2222(+)
MHGINAAGAVVNPLNTRLDAGTLAYILGHSQTKVLLADTSLAALAQQAIHALPAQNRPRLVDVPDPVFAGGRGSRPKTADPERETPHVENKTPCVEMNTPVDKGAGHIAAASVVADCSYEELLEQGRSIAGGICGGDWSERWVQPLDEWQTQAINYTSGTTGRPKGVLYSHRGVTLTAINNALTWGMAQHPTYLWTLPMFHCDGWCFPFTITMQAGLHVCLRSVDPPAVFAAISSQRVTHMCGAPTVASMLLHAPQAEAVRRAGGVGKYAAPSTGISSAVGAHPTRGVAASGGVSASVKMLCAGAPPPPAVLQAMEDLGFETTHVYGLTESYGPAVGCAWQAEWAGMPSAERAEVMARQGVRYPMLEGLRVVHIPEGGESPPPGGGLPSSWVPVARDGNSLGEVVMRGNVVMKGYLGDEDATEAALGSGWLRTGDLAVMHPSGYLEIKDRAKDIIISGGENISTVEIESVLFCHPFILEAAVVAMPHPHWGETPCAFVTLRHGHAWLADTGGGGAGTAPAATGRGEAAAGTSVSSLRSFCRERMAAFKVPGCVVHLPGGLPKTSTGKVQKVELRRLARQLAEEGVKGDTGGGR